MEKQILDLSGFNGSESFFRHWTKLLIYTEGIKYLAEKAGAYWLIDLVASYQPKLKEFSFQLWQVKKEEKGFVISIREDTNESVILSQKIEYSDFPLDNFEFYVIDGVMLLKSEN